jgi:hypothetical protein
VEQRAQRMAVFATIASGTRSGGMAGKPLPMRRRVGPRPYWTGSFRRLGQPVSETLGDETPATPGFSRFRRQC